jgi:hypothetical protein
MQPEVRARLEKLAAYLESLPADYEHFDMIYWIEPINRERVLNYARHNGGVPSCGTAACAAGHGPAAGILFPEEFLAGEDLNWGAYANFLVGGDSDIRYWCFAGNWAYYDNSHYGAAARIRYALDKGSPPEGIGYMPLKVLMPEYAPYRIDAKVD